jgi:signal transduction histidine kinase/ActR/RegA family two-component response regulator
MKNQKNFAQNRMHVPILLPTGRDAQLVSSVLAREKIDFAVCPSLYELLEEIRKGCGPFILGDEAVAENDLPRLMEALDQQPEWSDLPAIFFIGQYPRWKALDHIATRRSISLIQRPVKKSMLILMIRAALEVRRRQYQVGELLNDLKRANEKLGARTIILQQLALELTRSEERERRRIAGMLHDDLQQILVSAKIQTEILTDSLDEKTAPSAHTIYTTLSRAIDTSRSLSHELNPSFLYDSNLGTALKQIATKMGANYGLRIDTQIEFENETGLVSEGIKVFACRTVQELFLNCAKHSGSKQATLKLADKKNRLNITLKDHGVGFDPKKLKIRSGWNGGFGLFSIQERAEALGGSFRIESSPGKGSCFILKIPYKTEALEEHKGLLISDILNITIKSNDTEKGIQKNGAISVIIADDHAVMRQGLVSLLENQPEICVVAEAANGQEAIDLALKLHPDVVLMDVSMPVLDGIKATRRIKSEAPDINIIGLSMHSSDGVREGMREAGAKGYLLKDRPASELVSAIKKIVGPH